MNTTCSCSKDHTAREKRQHLVLRRKRHESEGERGQARWRGRDATCFDDEREDPRQAHDRESALAGLEGVASAPPKATSPWSQTLFFRENEMDPTGL